MRPQMTGLDRAARAEAAAYVDGSVAFRREQRDLPSLVAAIRHMDEVLLCKGYGYAQREPPVANDARARLSCRIALQDV